MLDANIKEQLQGYMGKLQQPIELVAAYDDSAKSREMKELLVELGSMSDKISLRMEEASDVRRGRLEFDHEHRAFQRQIQVCDAVLMRRHLRQRGTRKHQPEGGCESSWHGQFHQQRGDWQQTQ